MPDYHNNNNSNGNAYPYTELSEMLTCMQTDRSDCDANTDDAKSGL